MMLQHGPNQAALAMGQWRKQVDASLIFLLTLMGILNFDILILLGKTLFVSLQIESPKQYFKLIMNSKIPRKILPKFQR